MFCILDNRPKKPLTNEIPKQCYPGQEALSRDMQYKTYIEEQLEHATKKQKEKQVNKRAEILDAAKAIVCNDRENQYGSPEDNFKFIAELWTAYLYSNVIIGDLSATDVAIMMALFKIGRMMSGKSKEDNWIDAIGYLACGAELELTE